MTGRTLTDGVYLITSMFIDIKKKTIQNLLIILFTGFLICNESHAKKGTEGAEETSLPTPSSTAQRLYASVKSDLLQIRILLKNGRAQSAVGSGFLIGHSNLVVTNYHVVSQIVMKPDTYTGEYIDTNGRKGAMELLAVDALHDLAVVRINRNGSNVFKVPESPDSLKQGQYLYSLGNPLDLGFAISEGSYNGVIRQVYSDQLMFTGPINSGMSGGPNITVDGKLAGVNVSKRTDGELVSFLVPARYVTDVVRQAQTAKTAPKDFINIVGKQLLTYQSFMVNQLLETPFSIKTLGKYRVPVRESEQMRCWGQSLDKPETPYTMEKMMCSMESDIFVSDDLHTGSMSISHTFTKSNGLGPFHFARLVTKSFKDENLGASKSRNLTGPKCAEKFITNGKLPLRAVICIRAYRKFEGLYNFTVLTVTTDEPLMSLQSRLDIKGISYENGLKVSQRFIESIGREKKR